MGLKSRLTSWVVGQAVDEVLEESLKVKDASKRKRVVKAAQKMLKKPKDEPIAYGGMIGVAVALAAAFGLDLPAEQLGITVATIVTIITFIQRALVSPVSKEKDQ